MMKMVRSVARLAVISAVGLALCVAWALTTLGRGIAVAAAYVDGKVTANG